MPPCTASSVTILPLAPHATRTFITFPWRVYRGDHLWVPPLLLERKAFLNPRKNPFFQHAQVQLFLAQQGKETVGRIAAGFWKIITSWSAPSKSWARLSTNATGCIKKNFV